MKDIALHANWLIKAPPAEVFNIMTDFEKWPEYFPKVAESIRIVKREGNNLEMDATVKSFGQKFPVKMKMEILPGRGYISDNESPKFGTSGHEELLLSEHPEGTVIDYTYQVSIHKRWLRIVARPLIGWFSMRYWQKAVIDELRKRLERQNSKMKWVLFTGTWRLTNKQVEEDVRQAAREVIARGEGVLTGGATGVDFFAMDEVLKLKPDGSQLKVVIPAYLDDYADDYYQNWCQEPITKEDVDKLVYLLRKFKELKPDNLIEMPYHKITEEHYFMRDTEEVKLSQSVHAFQVNGSIGTQDTIDKAIKYGLPVTIHKKYQI